ncbi:MAG: CHAT domain-containing tetratricopeptide repeat protein [Cyclobacteriaceae bacterium]
MILAKQTGRFGKQIYLHDKLAENYSYFGQLEIGKAHIDTALQIAEVHDTHYEYIGMCYSTLATYYTETGDHKNGLELFKKTLDYRLKYLGKDHEDISNSYFVLGYYYLFTRKEYDKAIFYNEKALEMRIKSYGKESGEAGECYNNLATAYKNLGDEKKALKYQTKATEIFEQTLPENSAGILQCYSEMAYYYYRSNDLEKSFYWLQKVADAEENSENYFQKINTRSQKADYLMDSEPELAKSIYINILNTLSNKYGDRSQQTSNAHYKLSNYYSDHNNYDSALYHLLITDSLMNNRYGANSIQYADVSRSFARLYLKYLYFDLAIDKANQAIEIISAKTLNSELPSIDSTFKYPVRMDIANILFIKGRALSKKNSIEAQRLALTNFIEAIEIFEQIKRRYTTDNSRAALSENTQLIYNDAIQCAIKLADQTGNNSFLEVAFTVAERARAFNLLNDIQESEAKNFAGIPDAVIQKEESIRTDITFYRDLVYRYSQYTRLPADKVKQAKATLLDLERQFDNLIYSMEANYPDYYEMKNKNVAITPQDVQAQLSDKEALLEYYIGKDYLTIFILTRNQYIVHNLKDTANIRSEVKNLYNAINKYENDKIRQLSGKLYNMLFYPFIDTLPKKIKKLKVIPHRELNFLPYESLVDHDGHYLIEKFNISYYYSSFFVANDYHSKQNERQNILIYAPVYDDQRENNVPELPQSKKEAESIYHIFGATNSSLITHETATKAHFKNKSASYDIIHLATHTNLSQSAINFSTINFWGGKDNQLTLAETYNLDITPSLLTLSSCESGVGKLIGGEGMLSFTRGFSYSGAKNIICSLWKVNDYYTSQTMSSLYSRIKEGAEYSEALRLAKIELLQSNPDLSPKDWAGFILISN